MGSDLEDCFPKKDGAEKSAPLSDGDIISRFCPDYLAMGMSAQEYWEGDAELCRYYREANRLKREQANRDAWMQGLYIYRALQCVSPMFRDWVKDHKPEAYLNEPIPIYEKKPDEKDEDAADLETQSKLKDWIKRSNNRFKKKEVADGR